MQLAFHIHFIWGWLNLQMQPLGISTADCVFIESQQAKQMKKHRYKWTRTVQGTIVISIVGKIRALKSKEEKFKLLNIPLTCNPLSTFVIFCDTYFFLYKHWIIINRFNLRFKALLICEIVTRYPQMCQTLEKPAEKLRCFLPQ